MKLDLIIVTVILIIINIVCIYVVFYYPFSNKSFSKRYKTLINAYRLLYFMYVLLQLWFFYTLYKK